MQSRREFLKRAGYVAPAIVTLSAVPAFAGSGSGYASDGHRGQGASQGLDLVLNK
jgi:hypothetical protein